MSTKITECYSNNAIPHLLGRLWALACVCICKCTVCLSCLSVPEWLSCSRSAEGCNHKLLMGDIWQCSECQSPSIVYLHSASCTAPGLTRPLHAHLKQITSMPLHRAQWHETIPCVGSRSFFAPGPVSPIMTFSFNVPRKFEALHLAKVLPGPSQQLLIPEYPQYRIWISCRMQVNLNLYFQSQDLRSWSQGLFTREFKAIKLFSLWKDVFVLLLLLLYALTLTWLLC